MKNISIQIDWDTEFVRATCLNHVICHIVKRGRGDGTCASQLAEEIRLFLESADFAQAVLP